MSGGLPAPAAPLAGKLALVTGASRGIGLAVAGRLHAAGAHVVRLARSLADASTDRRTDVRCDVADAAALHGAIARVLAERGSAGQTYELAGPGAYTLRELVGFVLRLLGKRRLLVPVPFAVAEVQARLFELLPSPPLTTSQVDLLRRDNLASGDLPGFRDLDIRPKGIEEIVPSYVGRSRGRVAE